MSLKKAKETSPDDKKLSFTELLLNYPKEEESASLFKHTDDLSQSYYCSHPLSSISATKTSIYYLLYSQSALIFSLPTLDDH